MIALLLALLAAPPPPGELRVQDVEFARVGESWVVKQVVFPKVDTRFTPEVRALGDDRWRTRDTADKAIRKDVRRHFRALIAAEHSPDPEIAMRASSILNDAYCTCRAPHDDYNLCHLCYKSGDFRFAIEWDAEGYRIRIGRDLFAPAVLEREYGVKLVDAPEPRPEPAPAAEGAPL